MIKEPSVEFADHKQSRLSFGVVHDPWGISDGDPVPTFLRLCVREPGGQETEFLISKDAAPQLMRSIEDALRTLAHR